MVKKDQASRIVKGELELGPEFPVGCKLRTLFPERINTKLKTTTKTCLNSGGILKITHISA
jgi:hypothetical protein